MRRKGLAGERVLGVMARLAARTAQGADVEAIVALNRRVFKGRDMTGWEPHHLEAHLDTFPDGQFVLELGGDIVASSSSLRVPEPRALEPHTWMSITGGNELPKHDPDGDVLYGLEIMVDPARQGLGFAQMLYRARKVLCRVLGLKGLVVGGRIPGFSKARQDEPALSVEAYVERVASGKAMDPVLTPQLAAGFTPRGVLENYVLDPPSMHQAVRLTWEA